VIDLHTHLLPGVDDGARDLAEALELSRRAAEDGTEVAVVTPHSWGTLGRTPPGGSSGGDPSTAVAGAAAALQAHLDAAGIALRLAPGMEVDLRADLPRRPDLAVTLGGSRYLLLELPAQGVPAGTADLAFRLRVAGYVPVLAHPERNLGVIDRPQLVYDLVAGAGGCLAQLTAASLLGAFGAAVRATAEVLLEAGLVHVIASDAHGLPRRPPGLSAAVARAGALVGPDRARAMVTATPRAILDDREITPARPALPRRRRAWALPRSWMRLAGRTP
jgi:protein-tyrosine phosphatase